jgi:hypothetical protein
VKIHTTVLALSLLLLALVSPQASAAERTICVYDPIGRAGDYYRIMEDFSVAAAGWGVSLSLKAYTDEETAARDYEAGHCDGVLATGVRLQRFNRFPSTLEAMGALPTYDHLRSMVDAMARYPSAAARLRTGDHQTTGFITVGAAYLFLRDRSRDTVQELAGLRVATMDYDKASPVMVDRVGAIRVSADLGSLGPKFNNGDVDACYMSAGGYRPFELARGLEPSGGILRYPLAQATLQLIVRAPLFPDDFPGKSLTWFSEHFDDGLKLVQAVEADIPTKYWVDIPPDRIAEFDELFLQTRLRIRDEHKAYDPHMLSAMYKLRCSMDATRPECAEGLE